MDQRVFLEFLTQNNYCFINLIVIDLNITYVKMQSLPFTFSSISVGLEFTLQNKNLI